MTMTRIDVTPELLRRYDRPGPRYTSYPTAPEWREDFRGEHYQAALVRASQRQDEGLSLYVHIPFCNERCLYCGCNVVISKKPEVAGVYVDYLEKELRMVAEALGERRTLKQIHWGGGTPTYLVPAEMRRLFAVIRDTMTISEDAEIALEVDPRVTSREQLQVLRRLGFNRISMGVQDLDPLVQKAIGRHQTEDETRRLFSWCRELGFEGINIDLIFGLPEQKLDRWEQTIASVIDIGPDRLAVYSYAHLPSKLKHQLHIDANKLPTAEEKYQIFSLARRMFEDAGYRPIGMDHFAKPADELAKALDEHRLHRNFMGYTVVPVPEMVGIGASAIGEVGGVYAQNEKRLIWYYRALDQGRLPTSAGCVLSEDDSIRRWFIRQLMCNFRVQFDQFEEQFGLRYDDYFAAEEAALGEFYDEGMIARTDDGLQVLPLGQVFIRNLAMVFDAYLKKPEGFKLFSRTV
jgi:oxygen-independent coproporphyrinogen III oxidase